MSVIGPVQSRYRDAVHYDDVARISKANNKANQHKNLAQHWDHEVHPNAILLIFTCVLVKF